ncbi:MULTISPECIES: ATP-binding protein [Streptomyces]|uniref:ATP-binding protein n=2 Tax=Streptomyces TaxID=1883 RepID=A0A2U9PEZ3_STRAS|nr:ATP-binding protein [Streptomyces actuosus]AWT47865.1 ATP-binding protein [Streptomyces actuosus]MBM4822962.1 ATP-binding protein [Streptomyces actuosus]
MRLEGADCTDQDRPLARRPILSALAFEGANRPFLTDVQAVHGIPVSDRATGTVQMAVSELVTNAYKYAPGPCLLDLEVSEGTVQISVWDTDTTLSACLADPGRVGQHGLEIVMAVCQSFEVRREPVGKRVRAAIVLADGPGGDPAGRLL